MWQWCGINRQCKCGEPGRWLQDPLRSLKHCGSDDVELGQCSLEGHWGEAARWKEMGTMSDASSGEWTHKCVEWEWAECGRKLEGSSPRRYLMERKKLATCDWEGKWKFKSVLYIVKPIQVQTRNRESKEKRDKNKWFKSLWWSSLNI